MSSPPGSPQFLSSEGPQDPSPVKTLPESEDNLDSLLPTTLDSFDDEYNDLAFRRLQWWATSRLREWFSRRNYNLYEHMLDDRGLPSGIVRPTTAVQQRSDSTEFPFAYHDAPSRPIDYAFPPLSANTGERGIIGYAQDASGRHVAIKAILRDSKEKQILEYLRNECFPKSINEFQNVLPVLDILPCEGHWLAVMPRWGDNPLGPSCSSMKEVFHFIRCILNGLSFLHEHRISHGDIRLENILVNHAYTWNNDRLNDRRASLRTEGKLTYSLFDFSHANMFPRSVPIETCRLPSELSFAIWPHLRPSDTLQGELDFDPFAYDVGVLGIQFCKEFQHLIPVAPMLAPLLDNMTTWDIPRRFTASEALSFLDEHVDPRSGSPDVSVMRIRRPWYPKRHGTYDRWENLHPDFVLKWGAYRTPPIPWHMKLLQFLCERHWGWYPVHFWRRLCRWYFPQCVHKVVS